MTPANDQEDAATTPCRCRRTLIVEDDRVSRHALEMLVDALGHQTRSAATLANALEQLAAREPDCIVLDLMLPDGPGTVILERLRGAGRRVRVAVATGAHGLLVDEAEALCPGALFRKPIDVARLAAWLEGTGG